MDKRKLLKSSLHKDVQPIDQSLEKINSISDKQISSRNNVITQKKSDLFHEERLLDNRSTLKSSNIYSREKHDSFIKSRKRSFCEFEGDVSDMDDLAVTPKILKAETLSKQFNNQVSANASFISSQQEDILLSTSSVLIENRSLDTVNPSVEKSQKNTQKHKIINLNLSEETSDNDLDLLHNVCNVIKEKGNKTALDRNTMHTQYMTTSHNSSRKVYYELSSKTITKSYISQKKQDKSEKFQSEKHKINNEELKKHVINNKEDLSEKLNCSKHVSFVFLNFLRKCGIVLSADGICTLSKFFIIHLFPYSKYNKYS